MLIAIDMRSVGDKLCGVSRMAINLVRSLASIDTKNQYLLYTSPSLKQPIIAAPNFTERKIPISRYTIKEHIFLRDEVKKDMPDIFHSPDQHLPFYWNLPIKRIVTVCDLFAPKYPWFFEQYRFPAKNLARKYFDMMMNRTLNQTDLIVAISQYTKDDIIEKYHIENRRIKVVYLAAGKQALTNCFNEPPKSTKIEENAPYCLFVGNFKRYKNIEGAISAIAAYNIKHPNNKINLVVAGNDTQSLPRVKAYAQSQDAIKNVVFMDYVDDTKLVELYKKALCLLFPSLYEGFGMPILEAMAHGVPVVCSNTTSLPEVSGGAALLVNPTDPLALANSIGTIIEDNSLRENLIKKGHDNVLRFTWKKTAQEYLNIYQQVFKGY